MESEAWTALLMGCRVVGWLAEQQVAAGVLVGGAHEQGAPQLAEVVGGARRGVDVAQGLFEVVAVEGRADQCGGAEEDAVDRGSGPAAQHVDARPGHRFGGHTQAPAHVAGVDVLEARDAEVDGRDAAAFVPGDRGHELLGGVAVGQQAGDHRAGADAEEHVHVVHGAVRQAVVDALERAELEEDGGDAAAGRSQGGAPFSRCEHQPHGQVQHPPRVALGGLVGAEAALLEHVAHAAPAQLDQHVVDEGAVGAADQHHDAVEAEPGPRHRRPRPASPSARGPA